MFHSPPGFCRQAAAGVEFGAGRETLYTRAMRSSYVG